MKNYSPLLRKRVKEAPTTLGTKLMRLAIKHEISVIELTLCTGACRQTVYSWSKGHAVSNAYRKQVTTLIEKFKAFRSPA